MGRQLSPHFAESEFTCNCGCKTAFVDSRLLSALEQLRTLVGKPIKILSGYRCIKNNAEAGGGKNSQHLYGKAVDLVISGFTVPQMYEAALQIHDFFEGGIGVYPANGFIHVDVRVGSVPKGTLGTSSTEPRVGARWGRIKKGKKDIYVSVDEALRHVQR